MQGSITTRVPSSIVAPRPRLDDAPGRLVAEDEREGADGGQGRGRARVVREEMEVAAADATGRHLDPRPRRTGKLSFGQVGQRSGECRVSEVEHDGAHERRA